MSEVKFKCSWWYCINLISVFSDAVCLIAISGPFVFLHCVHTICIIFFMPKLLSLVRETAFQCSNITSTLQSAFLDYVLSTLLPVQSARIDTVVRKAIRKVKISLPIDHFETSEKSYACPWLLVHTCFVVPRVISNIVLEIYVCTITDIKL